MMLDLHSDHRWCRTTLQRGRSVPVTGRRHGFTVVWPGKVLSQLQPLDRHCRRIRHRRRHRHLCRE